MKNSLRAVRSNPHNPLPINNLTCGEFVPWSLEKSPTSTAVALLELAAMDLNGEPHNAFCYSESNQIRWFSWSQIANRVAEVIQILGRFSLRRHAHIATQLPNSLDWIGIDLACQILGYTHVAADVRWPTVTTDRMLAETQCDLVFTLHRNEPQQHNHTLVVNSCKDDREESVELEGTTSHADNVSLETMLQAARKVDAQSPAQILFTSGTTGMPKPVVLSHRNLVSNALAKLDAAPQSSLDLRLNVLPFCHAYARTCELSTWILTGGKFCIANGWNHFLELAPAIKPTLVNLVPHLVNKLSECNSTGENLKAALGGNVRLLQVGGAALADAAWNRFAEAGLPPLQGYGLTEASPVICSNRAGKQRPGTIGHPVLGVETKIDASGQLWARGENIMLGYFNDPKATAERLQDGWLATGDLVEQDSQGHLRVTGRVDHRIVLSTGLKVSPELIESRLMALSDIEQILVVGTNQPFLLALVWLKQTGEYDERELEMRTADLQKMFDTVLNDFPDYMRPKMCKIVVSKIASSMLNSKGQLVRPKAIDACRSIIEEAYCP